MEIPETISKKLPLLEQWIRMTVQQNTASAKLLVDFGMPKLPLYCSKSLLASTKVVEVAPLPLPPLLEWGITEFQDFVGEPFLAITYLDMIFVLPAQKENEAIFFHELVHVLQWKHLGVEPFLRKYVGGLLIGRYYSNPLELMAYQIQEEFEQGGPPFDLEKRVLEELQKTFLS